MGTAINMGAVILGAAVGVGLGQRLPARVRETVMDGLGLLTFIMGLRMAFETEQFLVMLGSILLGGLVGEALAIERRLESFGDYLQARMSVGSSTFSTGFVTASLMFCVGPLAVLGSIEDGLKGTIEILAVKSVLDGFASLAFAATLGWGVAFSALPLMVYQGALTLGAGFFDRVLTEAMINEMTAVGGLLVLSIGLRLLGLREIRTGNLLPGLLLAPVLVVVGERLSGLL
ncbi:MAG: DUF554 domain-containing protein [Actinobacteria bacterium]|nr:DUF554 domain-containing protein [Actinomycetota bacterium]